MLALPASLALPTKTANGPSARPSRATAAAIPTKPPTRVPKPRSTRAHRNATAPPPPKQLGDLRENLSRGVQTASVAEIHKDYTHSGVEELMRLLRSEL